MDVPGDAGAFFEGGFALGSLADNHGLGADPAPQAEGPEHRAQKNHGEDARGSQHPGQGQPWRPGQHLEVRCRIEQQLEGIHFPSQCAVAALSGIHAGQPDAAP